MRQHPREKFKYLKIKKNSVDPRTRRQILAALEYGRREDIHRRVFEERENFQPIVPIEVTWNITYIEVLQLQNPWRMRPFGVQNPEFWYEIRSSTNYLSQAWAFFPILGPKPAELKVQLWLWEWLEEWDEDIVGSRMETIHHSREETHEKTTSVGADVGLDLPEGISATFSAQESETYGASDVTGRDLERTITDNARTRMVVPFAYLDFYLGGEKRDGGMEFLQDLHKTNWVHIGRCRWLIEGHRKRVRISSLDADSESTIHQKHSFENA